MMDKTRASIRGRSRELSETTKTMRRKLTPAEDRLWNALRDGQLNGLKFRRQHAVGRCILDFYCPALRMAIEVDGGIHDEQVDHDEARTKLLGEYGIKVMRFRNEEVNQDLMGVRKRILAAADECSVTQYDPTKQR